MALTEKEIENIREYLSQDDVKRCRNLLRAVAGNGRFNILVALSQAPNGMTVSELAKLFGYSVSRVSHQLRILRKNRMVNMRRSGKSMVYTAVTCPQGNCQKCPLRHLCPGGYCRQTAQEQ